MVAMVYSATSNTRIQTEWRTSGSENYVGENMNEFLAPFTLSAEQVGLTLAALLRQQLPGQSWNQVRRLIETRRTRVNGELCLDPARRLKEGETVELLARPAMKPRPE